MLQKSEIRVRETLLRERRKDVLLIPRAWYPEDIPIDLARVAMCSQMLNIPIDMPEDTKEEQRGYELGEGNTRAEAIDA